MKFVLAFTFFLVAVSMCEASPIDEPQPQLRRVTKDEYNSADFHCEPKEAFKLECNTCSCSDDGKTYSWCTRIGCLGVIPTPAPIDVHEVSIPSPLRQVSQAEYEGLEFSCEPKRNFRLDCNLCKCAEDGKTVFWCTKMGCGVPTPA